MFLYKEIWCDRRLQDDEFINYRDEGIKSFNAEVNTYRLYDEHIGNMSENDEKELFNYINKKLELVEEKQVQSEDYIEQKKERRAEVATNIAEQMKNKTAVW